MMLRLPTGVVRNDVEHGWINSSLPDSLADQEEVEALATGDHGVNHCSRGRVIIAPLVFGKESSVYSLGDDCEDKAHFRVLVELIKNCLQLLHFVLIDLLDLSLADAIAVDKDSVRKSIAVVGLPLLKSA